MVNQFQLTYLTKVGGGGGGGGGEGEPLCKS